ncbi:hypothetical protein [Magnetospirillum moscoviense]|nr:hypothetical protein [Magnetospirillum moscoviense]
MDKPIIIGIDVSKEWLDAALAGEGRVERLDNTAKAIGAWLLRARPTLVAFEATGGYERTLRDTLIANGVAFVRVHPNDVLAFSQGPWHQSED